MATVGRHFPPPCLFFLLPSLLLIICLDGEATEEGGGLHPSSPGDNGDPTGPDPVPTAGNTNASSLNEPDFIQSHQASVTVRLYSLNKNVNLCLKINARVVRKCSLKM